MQKEMIKDEYGSKIGGSKRDNWKIRGLIINDLNDMNDAEIVRDVKKNNIFPTPDYKAMKEAGEDIKVIYFKKLVKDNLATKPRLSGREAAAEYIESIAFIRDSLAKIHDYRSCEGYINAVLIPEGFLSVNTTTWGYSRYSSTPKGTNIDIGTVYNKINNLSPARIERIIKKKEFLYDDFEKFAKNFMIYAKQGRTACERYGSIGINYNGNFNYITGITEEAFNAIPEENYYLVYNYTYITNDASKEALEAAIRKVYEKNLAEASNASSSNTSTAKKKTKKRFIPANLDHCVRTVNGIEKMVEGVDPEEILKAYKVRGCEFGNWINDDTRQENVDRCYEALADLATALDIPADKISLNGRLAIAFAARGQSAAAAHYEPAREVINLTKFAGAGALCHEYGHALDDIIGKLDTGKSMSDSGYRCTIKAYYDLLMTMKYKSVETVVNRDEKLKIVREQSISYANRLIDSEFRRASLEDIAKVKEGTKKFLELSREEIEKFAEGEIDVHAKSAIIARELTGKLEELKKAYIPRAKKLTKDFTDQFVFNVVFSYLDVLFKDGDWTVTKRTSTDFYRGSKAFDNACSKESNGYWQSDCEMFARAFSCYIEDVLAYNHRIRNDYLCGKSNCFAMRDENGEIVRAYPYGDERTAINEAFDALIQELKDKHML